MTSESFIPKLFNNLGINLGLRQLFAVYVIIVVIITWPEKFDFVIVPEHDITGICI